MIFHSFGGKIYIFPLKCQVFAKILDILRTGWKEEEVKKVKAEIWFWVFLRKWLVKKKFSVVWLL